jgi:hypothetical protein
MRFYSSAALAAGAALLASKLARRAAPSGEAARKAASC